MARYTQQQLDSQYEKLPQVLREAIFSAEIAEKMYEIGRRNGLNVEKTGFLAEEAGYIVLGLTHPREFLGQLTERLEITTDKAKEVAQQVNHEIFFPLHEALKQAHGVDVKEETIEKAEPLLHKQAPYQSFQHGTGQARTVPPPAAGERTQSEQTPTRQTARTASPSPRAPAFAEASADAKALAGKTAGEVPPIDLRPQYRPRMPDLDLPPSKIPPINLRAQRDGGQQTTAKSNLATWTPQGGVIPKQGVSFPPKAPAPPSREATKDTVSTPKPPTPPSPKAPASAEASTGKTEGTAGENIKTSPFGISSGKSVEDLEKKMQQLPPAPPHPSEELRTKNLELREKPVPLQEPPEPAAKENATKQPAPPTNIPLKEEVSPAQPAPKKDQYREPIE